MIAEACTLAVVGGLGFVVGRFYTLAQSDDALNEARADRDRAERRAADAQVENDRACTDAAATAIALDQARGEVVTLRLQLAAARVKVHSLRAAVTFWMGCFQSAHLAFLAVGVAHTRVAEAPSADPVDLGRFQRAQGFVPGAPS